MEYSGFWRRFFGYMIDGIISWLIGIVFSVVFRTPFAPALVFAIFYEPFFVCSALQATPGKAMMGLRVVGMNGERISFKVSVGRYLMKIVSSIILCIGYLIQPFTEKRQALHDIVAGTLVIDALPPKMNYFRAWYEQVQVVLGMTDKTSARSNSGEDYSSPSGSVRDVGPAPTASPADLAGLYDLYQKGILTEAEYNQKREELLKKL
ncbi:MAG: hypothetical protein EOP06_31740 [Proteobacteria bacterium]|nr:MAG: hypothetical protein EOP06_31740 [Pseudomonadota bacterium]